MTKPISISRKKNLFALLRMMALPVVALSCAAHTAHAATLFVSANPVSVSTGVSSTLTWTSTGAASCAASGAWSGVKATSGSQSVTAPNGLSTYALNCSGPGGSASNSVVIGAGATPPALYALNVTVSGVGTVTSNPSGIACGATCSASYPSGAVVTLSAVPAAGYAFSNWSGACTGTGACTTTLSAARSVTATFAPSAGNAISLSLVPARTSGVAPLAVFFDASGTTDTSVTTRPFHDLEYRWNFGDVNAGVWANGAQPGVSSKNSATGPVAAHVFETPGTYTVSVTAFDGANINTTTTTISVSDPNTVFAGANTICFSTGTDFTGCPVGGATYTVSDFSTAINTYQATGKRLLFKRGDTFTAGVTRAWITVAGPGTVGAFGSGAAPVMQNTGTTQMLLIGKGTPRNIRDWRFMDFTMDGGSDTDATHNNTPISAANSAHEMLFLRLNIKAAQRGILANHFVLSAAAGDTLYDGWTIQDSTIRGIPGCLNASGLNGACDWRIYAVGTRLAIQGNDLDNEDTGGSHVLRSEFMQRGVISHNRLANAGGTQHAIKLHAAGWTQDDIRNPGGVGTYSEKIVISDNRIVGHNNAWTVSFGPQNSSSDERVRDISFERNWVTSGAGTSAAIESSASRSTFRNNLIDLTNSLYNPTGIAIGQRGIEPVPDMIEVYNNTIYRADSNNDGTAGVRFGNTLSAAVKNNLMYAPLAGNPANILGTPTTLVQSNNTTSAQVTGAFPGWVSASPKLPADFKLTGTSYALDAGASIPLFSDFFQNLRPKGSGYDIGAMEGN